MAYAFNEDRSKVEVYTADEIDVMHAVQTSRIDTIIDHDTDGTEMCEEIWSSNAGVVSGTISVPDFNPFLYDCFEILIGNGNNDTEIHRVAKDGGTVSTSVITGDNKMQTGSISVVFATNEILITNARYIEYASSGDTHTFANSTTSTMPVLKAVYGIKYAQDCSTEVADIRVGHDGTVYPTAGDAVREQIEALWNFLGQ